MGNIDFTIDKVVTLDKTVNLVIDKNVEVNVDIDDLLATAEADAEAFGKYGLAETDAFTYVRETPGDSQFEERTIFNEGDVQIEGGLNPFNDGLAERDPIFISFNQAVSPGENGQLPDLDDLNGLGVLAPIDGLPPGTGENDIGLPQPNDPVLIISDLNLTDLGNPPIEETDGTVYEYASDALFQVDFGNRWIDRNLNGIEDGGERGALTLNVEAGEVYEVLFANTGGVEIELATTDAFFNFVPDGGADLESNNEEFNAPARVDMVIDSLDPLAGYELIAVCDFPWNELVEVPVPGSGEAFSYAESTAALDLNNDGSEIPVPVAEVI